MYTTHGMKKCFRLDNEGMPSEKPAIVPINEESGYFEILAWNTDPFSPIEPYLKVAARCGDREITQVRGLPCHADLVPGLEILLDGVDIPPTSSC